MDIPSNNTKKEASKNSVVQSQKDSEREKQWEFFQQLWRKLERRNCQSCSKPIYGQNKPLYWDHLLEKNKYPHLKYEERNMFFVCGDCHTKKTMGWPTPKHKEAIEKAKKELL